MHVNLRAERRRRGLTIVDALAAIEANTGTRVSRRVLMNAEHGLVPHRPAHQLAIATFYGFDLLEQWPEPDPVAAA